MASVANPPVHRAWNERFVRLRTTRSLIPAVIVGLSLIPILTLFARELWARPHYQFFPFVVPAAGLLLWRWCRDLGPLAPGTPAIAWGLGGIAWITLALSVACLSPGLGAVAAPSHCWLGRMAWEAGAWFEPRCRPGRCSGWRCRLLDDSTLLQSSSFRAWSVAGAARCSTSWAFST